MDEFSMLLHRGASYDEIMEFHKNAVNEAYQCGYDTGTNDALIDISKSLEKAQEKRKIEAHA
jgi:hypothetical protein